MSALQTDAGKLVTVLERAIGPVSDIWPAEEGWVAPHSYTLEMGDSLTTMVFVFDGLWHPDNLAWVKRRTLEVEEQFTPIRSRRFNLNPGVVDEMSMRLASHKPAPLRRQIGEDVWAEDQMYWLGNRLVPLDHTFQEYMMGTRLARLSKLGRSVLTCKQMAESHLAFNAAVGLKSLPIQGVHDSEIPGQDVLWARDQLT